MSRQIHLHTDVRIDANGINNGRGGLRAMSIIVRAEVNTGCNVRKPRLPDLRVSQSYYQTFDQLSKQ